MRVAAAVIAKNQIPTDDSEGDNSTGYDVNLQELHSRLFRRNTPTTPEITHADNFDRYKGVSVEESTHHHEVIALSTTNLPPTLTVVYFRLGMMLT